VFRKYTLANRLTHQINSISRVIAPLGAPVAFDCADPGDDAGAREITYRNRLDRRDIRAAVGNDPHLSGIENTSWPPVRLGR
jgi:hypothetical protein